MSSIDPPGEDGSGARRPLETIRCSFCGKRGTEVEKMIAGPTPAVAICNECVALYSGIVAEERADDPPPDTAA